MNMETKIITVTSGKGGVGKSTTSTNLGVGLARQGKKVVLIDGDTGVRKLDLFLGLEEFVLYDIVQVIQKECALNEAVICHFDAFKSAGREKDGIENLYFLPTSQTADKSDITPEDMMRICKELDGFYDFIIIDCPAGIEEGFKSSIAPCDLAIVVAVPEITSMRDADRVIGLLEKEDKDICVLINRIDRKQVQKGNMLDICDVNRHLNAPLLGIVPFDHTVSKYTNEGKAVVDNLRIPAGKAYKESVLRLLGKDIPIMTTCKQSLISRLVGGLKFWRTA